MGLFSKLFGSSKPAPPCELHENDRDLVKPDDIDWWKSLSFDDCVAFEREDNTFKFVVYKKHKDDGLDVQEAAKRVRKSLFFYYSKLASRSDPRFVLDDKDASLPYVLKDRINRAVVTGTISKTNVEQASSVNALVRQLIRSGAI